MFNFKRKSKKITLSTIDFNADEDKLIITIKDGIFLSPNQADELSSSFENIEESKSIIIFDVVKEIVVLKKYGKKK